MPGRLALLALVLALAAGPPPAGSEPGLTVYAAANLASAFGELVPMFERARATAVTLVLGSTGNLAYQIEHGAPADVFFAADERFVDRLVARGALVAETRTIYARGLLVLVTARGAGGRLASLDGLREPRIRRVAIANPAHAPYGRAAEEALRRVGLWEALRPKLAYAENIRQALQFVQTRAVEAGIVARSIADVPEVEGVPIDPGLHAPLEQAAALVARSPRRELGRALIAFVTGPEGQAILERYGYLVPGAR